MSGGVMYGMTWEVKHGILFSGPYRICWSHDRGDYVLWWCTGVGLDHEYRNSVIIKRGFDGPVAAQVAAAGHQRIQPTKVVADAAT